MNITCKVFLVGFLLLTQSVLFLFSQDLNVKKLDEIFEQSRKAWDIPGIAIAIVRNDSVILAKGYGIRDVEHPDQKVDENTLFGIASNTKAFTSSAIATLADDGKINLDDPVKKYLPYFELYDPYVSDAMTVRDLLCHRSGLKTFSGDLLWYSTNYSRKDVITRAKNLKPEYGFRMHYGYSNIMFLTAGEIIPVVTGKSWDEYLEQKFFKPLGMTSTNTSITKNPVNGNVAMPHVKENGKNIKIRYINWDNIAPAGAINSNVTDMSKWIKMQLNNGTQNGVTFFSKEVQSVLWTSHTPEGISEFESVLMPTMHFHDYGLGWDLFEYKGKKIVSHSGGLDGMISQVCLVPELKTGFVILTNSINWLPEALMYTVLDELLGGDKKDWSKMYLRFFDENEKYKSEQVAKAESERVKDSKPTLPLEKYAGLYTSKLYGDAKVTYEKGKLSIQLVPAPDFVSEMIHFQYDTFRIKWQKYPSLPVGTVHFTINANAEPDELRIDVPNPDFDFTELDFIKAK